MSKPRSGSLGLVNYHPQNSKFPYIFLALLLCLITHLNAQEDSLNHAFPDEVVAQSNPTSMEADSQLPTNPSNASSENLRNSYSTSLERDQPSNFLPSQSDNLPYAETLAVVPEALKSSLIRSNEKFYHNTDSASSKAFSTSAIVGIVLASIFGLVILIVGAIIHFAKLEKEIAQEKKHQREKQARKLKAAQSKFYTQPDTTSHNHAQLF
ncbi:hypothetical protein O181_012677 [Austropuccinia psidii MF-1]|uniref:Uncharacterized protein n=1 Tax=Austropuccinia psidii MF-1 TaxID=1389203 RepID=A0A9Q3GN88_9BASI|nr:hypothetical protein [Austropuccinia psidii MF-1]